MLLNHKPFIYFDSKLLRCECCLKRKLNCHVHFLRIKFRDWASFWTLFVQGRTSKVSKETLELLLLSLHPCSIYLRMSWTKIHYKQHQLFLQLLFFSVFFSSSLSISVPNVFMPIKYSIKVIWHSSGHLIHSTWEEFRCKGKRRTSITSHLEVGRLHRSTAGAIRSSYSSVP